MGSEQNRTFLAMRSRSVCRNSPSKNGKNSFAPQRSDTPTPNCANTVAYLEEERENELVSLDERLVRSLPGGPVWVEQARLLDGDDAATDDCHGRRQYQQVAHLRRANDAVFGERELHMWRERHLRRAVRA